MALLAFNTLLDFLQFAWAGEHVGSTWHIYCLCQQNVSALGSRGTCWLQAMRACTQLLAKLVPSMLFWSTTLMSKQAHKVCICSTAAAGSRNIMLRVIQTAKPVSCIASFDIFIWFRALSACMWCHIDIKQDCHWCNRQCACIEVMSDACQSIQPPLIRGCSSIFLQALGTVVMMLIAAWHECIVAVFI